jgi:hypothetical protein
MGCASSNNNGSSRTQNPVVNSPKSQNQSKSPLTEFEIQSRIEAPKQSQFLDLDGIKIRFAFVSQRGYYPEGMISIFLKR